MKNTSQPQNIKYVINDFYANANPVMYSDPSGYISASEMGTTLAVGSVLGGMIGMNFNVLRYFYDDNFDKETCANNWAVAELQGFFGGDRAQLLSIWVAAYPIYFLIYKQCN